MFGKEYPADFPEDKYTLERFTWALSASWSRSHKVRINEQTMPGLVPMADMLNTHHTLVNIQPRMTKTAVELLAKKTIKKGEQVCEKKSKVL